LFSAIGGNSWLAPNEVGGQENNEAQRVLQLFVNHARSRERAKACYRLLHHRDPPHNRSSLLLEPVQFALNVAD
jgi:hypothetical protein